MILVTLGTHNLNFDRILLKLEELKEKEIITEKINVITGDENYKSNVLNILGIVGQDEFNDLIEEADLIISHGGVGSLLTAFNKNKTVIGVAREQKYGESVNDHQKEILEKFNENKFLIYLKNIEELENIINQVQKFKHNKYKSNNNKFNDQLLKKLLELK